MSNYKDLKEYEEQIKQCVKCGACRAHCPVFSEQKRESVVARGKVALAHALLEQEVELDERLIADMSKCLLCGSCSDKCSNLVPTDEIVMAARREIAARHGLSSFGKAVSAVLKRPALMNLLARGGSALGPLLFKRVPETSGLRLRFPVPYLDRDRTLPEIAPQPFRQRHPEFIPGAEDQPVVAFFTGCMINYMFPEIGEAVVKVLRWLGMNVVLPADQGCCGLPALSGGDQATVETLADQNLEAFSRRKPDLIVTACASCHGGMSKHFAERGAEYADLGARVQDITAFLAERNLPEKLAALPRRDVFQKVTYHDPCHLRTEGITREPRELLRSLPGVRYVEMEHADRCCGLGGTFSVYHYDTSKKIGARKAPGIEQSGADLVASACPGCMMQLQDIITHAGLPQKVVHVLELVARELPDAPG